MDISIFDVTGPVMIGPSSSHTAGAAKLGRVALGIAGREFDRVTFGLFGSFARTYQGHGTDKALVAGILGMSEDDDDLASSFELADERGIRWEFYETELEGMHENSVKISFYRGEHQISQIVGSSIGGGQIVIKNVDGFETEMSAQVPTLLIRQYDRKGVISEVSTLLAEHDFNIGIMKVSRKRKGDEAFCIIETDDRITEEISTKLRSLPNVLSVKVIGIG